MICTYFLPSLAEPHAFDGRTVVVIDVLRATTTIVHALAAGAVAVQPCAEIDEALWWAEELGAAGVTGGERGGTRIDGFTLGNSPSQYTPQTVGGKTVIFTTTNGTRAMAHCRSARKILLAAFVNLSAVCDALDLEPEFDVLCAGTDGHISREDVLLAGALIADRQRQQRDGEHFNDQSELAADVWRRVERDGLAQQPLVRTLAESRGGRHLLDLGFEQDIEIAAELDKFQVVPQITPPSWQITLSAASPPAG